MDGSTSKPRGELYVLDGARAERQAEQQREMMDALWDIEERFASQVGRLGSFDGTDVTGFQDRFYELYVEYGKMFRNAVGITEKTWDDYLDYRNAEERKALQAIRDRRRRRDE